MNGKEYDDIVDFLDSDGVLVPKEVYCSSNPDKSEQEFRRKVKDYELTSEYELLYQDVRIVVPEDRMKLYIMLCHQPIIPHPTVHHSEDETYRIANSALFWPSLQKDVKRFCRDCPRCQVVKQEMEKLQAKVDKLLGRSKTQPAAVSEDADKEEGDDCDETMETTCPGILIAGKSLMERVDSYTFPAFLTINDVVKNLKAELSYSVTELREQFHSMALSTDACLNHTKEDKKEEDQFEMEVIISTKRTKLHVVQPATSGIEDIKTMLNDIRHDRKQQDPEKQIRDISKLFLEQAVKSDPYVPLSKVRKMTPSYGSGEESLSIPPKVGLNPADGNRHVGNIFQPTSGAVKTPHPALAQFPAGGVDLKARHNGMTSLDTQDSSEVSLKVEFSESRTSRYSTVPPQWIECSKKCQVFYKKIFKTIESIKRQYQSDTTFRWPESFNTIYHLKHVHAWMKYMRDYCDVPDLTIVHFKPEHPLDACIIEHVDLTGIICEELPYQHIFLVVDAYSLSIRQHMLTSSPIVDFEIIGMLTSFQKVHGKIGVLITNLCSVWQSGLLPSYVGGMGCWNYALPDYAISVKVSKFLFYLIRDYASQDKLAFEDFIDDVIDVYNDTVHPVLKYPPGVLFQVPSLRK